MNSPMLDEEKEAQGTEQFFLQVAENEDEQMDIETMDCLENTVGSQVKSEDMQTPNTSQQQDQERRAQVGESPYLAPLTPFDSPGIPKTPVLTESSSKTGIIDNVSDERRKVSDRERKADLDPLDVVQHLPSELVDALMATVQTLDKMIVVVEDYKPDQLDYLCEKTNEYIELLQRVDAAAVKYDVEIPIQVLEKMDAEETFNPERFTKEQLEICHEESVAASNKITNLQILKDSLLHGMSELEQQSTL